MTRQPHLTIPRWLLVPAGLVLKDHLAEAQRKRRLANG